MFYKKLISIFLIWQILFFNLLPYGVYAQEESPTPIATESPLPTQAPEPTESPIPTETPSETESPAPTPTSSPEVFETLMVDEPTSTPSATPLPTPSPSPEIIVVEQVSNTKSDTSSSSSSGQNSQTGGEVAKAETGDSTAVTDSVTVSNLSEVNANLIIVVETILTTSDKDIDIYQRLMEAIANNPNFTPNDTNIFVNQNAIVDSDTNAISDSGNNSQYSASANLTTGEAQSLANSITAANLNLVGGNVILAIINILGSYSGNIILPGENSNEAPNANVIANQNAITDSNTMAMSSTGLNLQESSNSAQMITGDSVSTANSATVSNIVQVGGGLNYLTINNLGSWAGSLINWNDPGAKLILDSGIYNLFKSFENKDETSNDKIVNIYSNQSAIISSDVSSLANSGNNQQKGDNLSLITGNSSAIANNFTLANITSVGGNIFFGIINILGEFSGDIISAYPNIEVSLSDGKEFVRPGDLATYALIVKNTGKAKALGVNLDFTWPEGITPIESIPNNWLLEEMEPGDVREFVFKGYLSNLLKDKSTLTAFAKADAQNTEESLSENLATDSTIVEFPNDPPPDTRTPDLNVSVWNNSAEFIRPGDTLLVKITLENKSPFIAKNVKLTGRITNEHPIEYPDMNWNLGNIRANGKATIKFSVTLKKDTLPALYHITSQASGQSDSGDTGYSNTSVSNFLVKNVLASSEKSYLAPTLAQENFEATKIPQTLGVNTQGNGIDFDKIFIYVLPILIVAYASIKIARKKLLNIKNTSQVIPDL